MPPSASKHVPARLIFSERETARFIEWQKRHTPQASPGNMRYALDYHRFVNHVHEDQALFTSMATSHNSPKNTAAACNHGLHPSDTRTTGYCPGCEVRMSLEFMTAIANALRKIGGPWRKFPEESKKSYVQLCEGWRMARLQLEHALIPIEVAVKYEEAWEAEHPHNAAAARKNHTSMKPLRLAKSECRYPASVSESTPTPQRRTKRKMLDGSIKSTKKTKKTVSFKPDTDFDPSRPTIEFHRDSPLNEPGTIAAPAAPSEADDEWEGVLDDTSFRNDGYMAIYNLKLHVIDWYSKDVFDTYEGGTDSRPGEYTGLVGMQLGLSEILGAIKQSNLMRDAARVKWREENADKPEHEIGTPCPESISSLIRHADALIILVKENEIMNMSFAERPEKDARTVADSQSVTHDRWTCWRECSGNSGTTGGGLATASFPIYEGAQDNWKKRVKVLGNSLQSDMSWFT